MNEGRVDQRKLGLWVGGQSGASVEDVEGK